MIEGLSHITFIVRDLNRMTTFLEVIFNAKVHLAVSSAIFVSLFVQPMCLT